jgi:hypothetical protein
VGQEKECWLVSKETGLIHIYPSGKGEKKKTKGYEKSKMGHAEKNSVFF